MKNYIAFALILVTILGGCLASASSINLASDSHNLIVKLNTFYVDDNADSSWYDTTHFRTIMDAINNASDGYTIFVYNGVYFESVTITKSISLIGEDKLNTIIDGSKIIPVEPSEFGASIFRIYKADGVTVSGFTIQNVLTDTFMVDAGFHIGNSNNDIISDNIICNIRDAGILIMESNHTISGNQIINTSTGIWCETFNTTITMNTITNEREGILSWGANGNRFTWNVISNCIQGILFLESSNNLIKRNEIRGNTEGIFLSMSKRNKFYENNFIESGYAGHVEFKGWSFFNKWRRNYWDNQIIHILPKILVGRFGGLPIPWFNFDWHPARKPYEI